ncbi:MAG: peptidase [Clostridia bacterium]|nr:peptidase [Clostridia bacterium]
MDIQRGIAIIMNTWLDIRRDELILLVTDETHVRELEAFDRFARSQDAILKSIVLNSADVQNGDCIDAIAPLLDSANVIIGATDYSFITARPVSKAVARGARFLSLPLSCSDGTSLLENEFIGMSPVAARRMAQRLLPPLERCDTIHVTTEAGTDLIFRKRGRQPGCYCGMADHRRAIGSASFEVYVPIEEHETEGRLILDGSLGYLGLVRSPIEIHFSHGTLSAVSHSEDTVRLLEYMEHFNDPTMYQAAEFGIGLNTISRCRGVSYIEDESTFHTFHIGMGRNISLGGIQEAAGHFDIVTHRPTIYAGTIMIMQDGELV